MIAEQYVWFVWASAFLIPWALIFVRFPQHRQAMLKTSLLTAPFGLTEPIFVPSYWDPPSLFSLAQRTGFDIESVIFSFAIGGIGSVLVNVLRGNRLLPVSGRQRARSHHRYHGVALATPVLVFLPLYLLPWNPIYPGILAMFLGGVAHVLCRPDLRSKVLLGGMLFPLLYIVVFTGMHLSAPPGYMNRVWNYDALTGIVVMWIPLEELLFAISFGMYWSGVYEHFTWTRCAHE